MRPFDKFKREVKIRNSMSCLKYVFIFYFMKENYFLFSYRKVETVFSFRECFMFLMLKLFPKMLVNKNNFSKLENIVI